MSPRRLLFYMMVALLLPALGVASFYWQRYVSAEEVRGEIEAIVTHVLGKQRRQHLNRCARAAFGEADHFYIDKELETLLFLNRERGEIEVLLAAERSLPDKSIVQRQQFLGENRPTFSEGFVHTFGGVTETQEALVSSVEVDEADLMRLLARLEGVAWGEEEPCEGRPQLLISDLRLQRKERGEGNEVFEIDLKFLKREFS